MVNLVFLLDARLPGLYRKVFEFAGIPTPPAPARGERFVIRSGVEPPKLFAEFLAETLVEDAAEVVVWSADATPDYHALGDGGLAVQSGDGMPCPFEPMLREAVGPGPALVFAVERRNGAGGLFGMTWAAVPEGEPPPTAHFRAAVFRMNAVRTVT